MDVKKIETSSALSVHDKRHGNSKLEKDFTNYLLVQAKSSMHGFMVEAGSRLDHRTNAGQDF